MSKLYRIIFTLILIISLSGFFNLNAQSSDCFSIIVGRNASIDGSVLFAHNEDDTSPQVVNWYRVPRLRYPENEKITLAAGGQLPQVAETWSYLWLEMPGMAFSDSYLNEWGVTIASDQCRSREKKGELTDGGIGYWLRRIMAERARSAREAVKIGGQLIEMFGYASSGRSYLIADPKEGWVLAAVQGKHWVAQRVPDDQVMVIPNYYTIGQIDLADTSQFLGSPDLIEYARQNGWYDPEDEFNFRQVYSDSLALIEELNTLRMWRGVNLLANKQYRVEDEFPFAFHPKKKLRLADLMAVLRDHYEGTEYGLPPNSQPGSPHQPGLHTICAESNQYGFVAQLRASLPVEVGAVLWLAPRRPDTQAFIPWYLGIEKIPTGYARGTYQTALRDHFQPPEDIFTPDPKLAFWAFVQLAENVDEDFAHRIQPVREKMNEFENSLLNAQPGFEKKVLNTFKKSPVAARKMLTEYTARAAQEAWDLTKSLE